MKNLMAFIAAVCQLSNYFTLTQYDAKQKPKPRRFLRRLPVSKYLWRILQNLGLTQLRIAETEKYPHVTFFFNGGEETVFKGEDRIMVPSPSCHL